MKINLVIPAAGEGTRLRPLSSNTSKAMVRIHGRPCIDYIIDNVIKTKDIEVEQIVIVDGKFDDIRDYVSKRDYGVNIEFIKQTSLKGPRDAIRIGMTRLYDKTLPIVVWLGDTIVIDNDLHHILGDDILLTHSVDDHSLWCIYDGTYFYNKPKKTIQDGVALIGVYSFSDGPKAIAAFNESDDYEISDALERYGEFVGVMTSKWYDIGEMKTYHDTCAALLNEKTRSFNKFSYNRDLNTITKTNTSNDDKIYREGIWYRNLSSDQSLFAPRVFMNSNKNNPSKIPESITMSYESGTTLSDLFLYDNLTPSAIEYIMRRLFHIVTTYFHHRPPKLYSNKSFLYDLWVQKTVDRLKLTSGRTNDINGKLLDVAINMNLHPWFVSTMHGDLHGGNIIYNPTNDHFIFVDPRGADSLSPIKNEGDGMYDWAKMAHDFFHGYGEIISGSKYPPAVKEIFLGLLEEYGIPIKQTLLGGALLLAVCSPLHEEPHRTELYNRGVTYINATVRN